jgi:hypothetical protein
MPEGHPHVPWAHVGAFWPVVPASDDANQPPAVEDLITLVNAAFSLVLRLGFLASSAYTA